MISLWADDPSQQKALFRQFFDVALTTNYALFHYGQYEAAMLRKMRDSPSQELRRCRYRRLRQRPGAPSLGGLLSDVLEWFEGHWQVLGFLLDGANASGLQSLAWRRRWELTGDKGFKQTLVTYNAEDCRALKCVTETLEAIGQQEKMPPLESKPDWEEVAFEPSKRIWGKIGFVLPDFDHINKCATSTTSTIASTYGAPQGAHNGGVFAHSKRNKAAAPNARVQIVSSKCPHCGCGHFTSTGKGYSQSKFSICVTTVWSRQARSSTRHCGCNAHNVTAHFLPPKYKRLDTYCHGLKSWVIYQHVEHLVSLTKLYRSVKIFHMHLHLNYVCMIKAIMAERYRPTFKLLMQRLLAGTVIYVDETEISLRHGKGYVWVLANNEAVVFLYRPNRESAFLKELLAGFQGVVVSDFYSGYDGLLCLQQKCLIHLIRDMNTDLRLNPFDDELKTLIGEFATLLRKIVETIDRHG